MMTTLTRESFEQLLSDIMFVALFGEDYEASCNGLEQLLIDNGIVEIID